MHRLSTHQASRPCAHFPSRAWRGLTRPAAAPPAPSSSSLIPDTLADLEADPAHRALIAAVSVPGGQAKLTASERRARQRALDELGVPPFARFVAEKEAEVGFSFCFCFCLRFCFCVCLCGCRCRTPRRAPAS